MPKCRDCKHLVATQFRGRPVQRCGQALWDRGTRPDGSLVRQWYSYSTVYRNRPPVREIGTACLKYAAK